MHVIDYASGSATGGTAATVSSLIGGVFNTTLPTLTNGQQSAIQLDSSGRLVIGSIAAPFSDRNGTGTAGAANATVVANTAGCSTVSFDIQGTWSGALVVEAQSGDSDWFSTEGLSPVFNETIETTSINTPIVVPCGGYSQVRLRMAIYVSGTANIQWNAGAGVNFLQTAIVGVPNLAEAYYSYSPDNGNSLNGPDSLTVDGSGRLETHSTVLTDEGSLRDDFVGTALTSNLTGTISVTNGNNTITGSGTTFTSQVKIGQYIGISSQSETLWGQVEAINSDTTLLLYSGYAGATAVGTGAVSNWQITSPGTGGSISVASSIASFASGTGTGTASIIRSGDYLPYNMYAKFSISQRIANQTITFGFLDVYPTPNKQAVFIFNGTTNTQVTCQTSFSPAAGDTQTVSVTLPGGLTTATANRYEIDLTGNQCTFFVNGIIVAVLQDHLPGPYDNLQIFAGITNTAAAASSTTLALDYIYFSNTDQVEITTNFSGEPVPVNGNVSSGNTDFGNPVKVGGVYNSTLPTLTTGQRVDLQTNARGQVLTEDTINVSSQYRAQSVTTTAAEATGAASRLVNRKFISITPTNGTIYWGTSSAVTTTTGSPLFPNNTLFLAFTDNVPVYVIAAATTDVRIVEGS